MTSTQSGEIYDKIAHAVFEIARWCSSQVVRQRSAKPLYAGAIPAYTSKLIAPGWWNR